jgi:hypothetical protein
MLPASAKGPPEMAQMKDEKPAPTKARTRPSRDALLQQVAKQPGGQEKVQKAKAKQQGKAVLRSSAKGPPEMAQMKDEKPEPTKARTRPSRDALLQQVAKQPGGQEKIQRANPKGFKLGPRSDATGWSLPSISSLNPFQAGVAHASSTPLILTPNAPKKTSPFLGYIGIFGEMGGYYKADLDGARLQNYSYPALGMRIQNPFVYLRFNAFKSGWYLINFRTYSYGAKATLKHYTGSGYATVQTWDLRAQRFWVDHPALLYLSAGYHSFYWVVEPGTSPYAYFRMVSVEKM